MAFENVDDDESVGRGIDRINARFFDDAGNRASGLCLEEIGMSGHQLANRLWRVSAYLRMRADRASTPVRVRPPSRGIEKVDTEGTDYV